MKNTTSQSLSLLLDIDGYRIDRQNVRTDYDGRHYDISQFHKYAGEWYYRNKLLHRDGSDTVHAEHAQFQGYRETPGEDEDEDEPMLSPAPLEGIDELPQSLPTKAVRDPAKRPPFDRYAGRDIPKLRDLALNTPQNSSVIKQPNHIPDNHYCAADDHYRMLQKRQAQLAHMPDVARKRKRLGFDAQELLLNGALNCSPCRPSTLIYDPTLTIFQTENFLDTPEPVLEVLKPALALAELILLKGNPRFWVDIACGTRVPDYDRIEKTGSRAERLIPVSTITKEMVDSTMAKLQALGKTIIFKFQGLKNVYGCAAHPVVMPMTRPLSGFLKRGQLWPRDEPLRFWQLHEADPWKQQAVVSIDEKFYAAAKSFSTQKYQDTAAQLRFTLFVAVNLLHEVSHCFESKCGHSQYYDLISKDRAQPGGLSRAYFTHHLEPAYKDYEVEMGAAFEYETFGGRVHPINHDFSAKFGINVYFGGGQGSHSDMGRRKVFEGSPYGYAIPMGYIEELHSRSYWDTGPHPNGVLVPAIGPKTYFMHSTATVDWREHLLEIDPTHGVVKLEEDFEEQTQISKRLKVERSISRPTLSESVKSKHPQRHLQTKFHKCPSKADAMRSKIKIDLRMEAMAKETGRQARRLEEAVAAEAAREYRPPSPQQPAIDDAFEYVNTEPQYKGQDLIDPRFDPRSERYDPLLKLPHELTIHDKWLLVEDYALLTLPWDSTTFLSRRQAFLSKENDPDNVLTPIPRALIPSNDPENWNEVHCGMLRVLREKIPGRGLIAARTKKREERESKKEYWRIKSEMEELVVRKGGNRVQWMRGHLALEEIGLEGMNAGSFDEKFRVHLVKLREQEKQAQRKNKGVQASGSAESPKEGHVEEDVKITKYFRPLGEGESYAELDVEDLDDE